MRMDSGPFWAKVARFLATEFTKDRMPLTTELAEKYPDVLIDLILAALK